MSHPKRRHWRLEVEWEDSTLLHDGWEKIGDIIARRDSRKPTRCLSVGVVLADDNRGVVLAASVHGNEAAGVTIIPRSAVRKRRRLR